MGFTVPNEAAAGYLDQSELDSVDFDILAAGLARTGVLGGCAVTPSGAMTVSVAAGTVVIAGVPVVVAGGPVAIGAAHATNARYDLIAVNTQGVISTVVGASGVYPAFPAIPVNSVILAAVYIPGALVTISSANLVDKRVMLNQGVFVQNATPTSPPSTYLWLQTGLGDGTDITLWVEDGATA